MKLRKYFSYVLILVSFLVIVSFSTPLIVKAETVSSGWVVNENASDLKVENIEEGGIGRISYYTVPVEGTADIGYGNPDGPVFNSVFIPVSNYDVNSNRISIKYETNIDTSSHNITLYARCDEYISDTGEVVEAQDVLIGWFVNWNVTTGKAIDGVGYITINQNEYTKTRDVKGIIIQFSYDDNNSSNEKWMKLLGVTYHNEAVTPTFASDPKLPTIGEPQSETATINKTNDLYEVSVSNQGMITLPVANWDENIADDVIIDIIPFAGLKIEITCNSEKVYEKEFVDNTQKRIEFLIDSDSVESLIMNATGSGKFTLSNLQLSTIPKVTNYSTAHSSYFSKFEEINEGTYQMDMIRNAEAGYPKVIVSVANYRDDYDVLCVDINAVTNIALLGITFNDANTTYVISHWDDDNFLAVGEHKLTFFNLKELCSEWNGDSFAIYVNPNSLETDGYNYQGEIKIGMYFIKSDTLLTPEITLDKASYEFDYDGTKHTITPVINPANLTYDIVYVSGDVSHNTGVSDAGNYVAKITVNGNREYKSIQKEVNIVVNRTINISPTIEDFEFDYKEGLIGFDNDIIVNTKENFDPLTEVLSGATIQPGQVLYCKRPESLNGIESEVFVLKVAEKAATPTKVMTSSTDDSIIIAPITNAEFCLEIDGVDGEWQTLNSFTGLTKGTEYTLKVRIKATDTAFASDVYEVVVKTTGEAEPEEPEEPENPEEPEQPEEPEEPENPEEPNEPEDPDITENPDDKGCSSTIQYNFITMIFVLSVMIILCSRFILRRKSNN